MERKLPILDSFTITTPSLSVVIKADDTPLPTNIQQQESPANLITVHAVNKESHSPSSPIPPSEKKGIKEEKEEEKKGIDKEKEEEKEEEEEEEQQHALLLQQIQQEEEREEEEHKKDQERIIYLLNKYKLNNNELKELKELKEKEEKRIKKKEEKKKEENEFFLMMRRASSKYANEVYRHPNAPPPIQELKEEINDEINTINNINNINNNINKYITKDFTYFDKLRRHNTQTYIRRWHTYVPTGEEDTAFFARNIQANIPGDAYSQGIYYKELDIKNNKKEYKLPTESYVAPPVYVHQNINRRILYDPIRTMDKRIHACTTALFNCSGC